MIALAYWHGPERIHKMALAFATGCRVHGIPCEVLHISECGHKQADLVWLYGLGEAKRAFDFHQSAVRLVGDKGYFAGLVSERYIRISVNAQQPDKHLRLRKHQPDRLNKLRLNVEPVTNRGEYVLLCGIGPKQCGIQTLAYGQWERAAYERIKQVTDRPILVREKPKNAQIAGLPRCPKAVTADSIREAWAVVCLTGNIGVDSIVHGVPVIAEAGPGSVYYRAALEQIETIQPLSAAERIAALSDIAYWQWRRDEFSSGALMDHIKREGLV